MHTVYIPTNTHTKYTYVCTLAHTKPASKATAYSPITHKHKPKKEANKQQPSHHFLFPKPVFGFSCSVTTIIQHLANLFSLSPLHELHQNKHYHTWQALENDPCLSLNGGAIFYPCTSRWRSGFAVILSTNKCICTWHTNTQPRNIHTRCTQATSNHFQMVLGLGGYVHLAMQLHQQATIRDLHLQNSVWHIDHLRQGIYIILYRCGSVEQDIECTVITTGVTCLSAIRVFTFMCLIQTTHSVNSIWATCDTYNFTIRAKHISWTRVNGDKIKVIVWHQRKRKMNIHL